MALKEKPGTITHGELSEFLELAGEIDRVFTQNVMTASMFAHAVDKLDGVALARVARFMYVSRQIARKLRQRVAKI